MKGFLNKVTGKSAGGKGESGKSGSAEAGGAHGSGAGGPSAKGARESGSPSAGTGAQVSSEASRSEQPVGPKGKERRRMPGFTGSRQKTAQVIDLT